MPVRSSSIVHASFASIACFTSLATACGTDESGAGRDGASLAANAPAASGDAPAAQFVPASGAGRPANCDPSSADQKGCSCAAGQTRACYSGPVNTRSVGACRDGQQSCIGVGEFGAEFGPCQGDVVPSAMAICTAAGTTETSVDAAAPAGACVFNGETIASGSSVTAYSVSYGACSSAKQTRYCFNGVLSGVGDYASCAQATLSVGQPCTRDTAVAVPSNASAINGCTPSWSTISGNSANTLYCDATSKWQCYLAGMCEQNSCASCMATHCSNKVVGGSAACSAGLQRAYDWLVGCGPDRPAYFNTFGASCTNNELSALNSCKFQYCYNGTSGGGCNGY